MLTKEELVAFYESYGLSPNAQIDSALFVPIMHDAVAKNGKPFASFVFESVRLLGETLNKFELKPGITSWDELYQFYCFFIVGFSGIKLSQTDAEGPR